MRPGIAKIYSDAVSLTCCPDLWAGMNLKQLDPEKPEHLVQLKDHMESHIAAQPDCPVLSECVALGKRCDDDLSLVQAWSWHWWLKDRLSAEYLEMLREPNLGTLYILLDFQDTTTFDPFCSVLLTVT